MQSAQFALHADIEERHWWFVARRMILQALIAEVLPIDRERTLIDVGCGTGGNIAAFAKHYRCVGIDPSDIAIQFARERFPQVEFLCGHAPEDLGALAETADGVLCTDVLEHVPDDFELFSKLLQAVPVETSFLLTVPAEPELWSRHDESHGHYRRYTLERFARIWQDLPVRTLLLSPYNARLYPIVKFIRGRTSKTGRAFGNSETDIDHTPEPFNGILRRVFSGEQRRLKQQLRRGAGTAYRRGVSLIALLQKTGDEFDVRQKPDDLEPDRFDPQTERPLEI